MTIEFVIRPGSPQEADQLRAYLMQMDAAQVRTEHRDVYGRDALDVVNRIYRARHLRDRQFGTLKTLFGEPAWDMLLDLYIADTAKRRISVSSLCVASRCAATTALRYISRLDQERLIVRMPDPHDNRRNYIELTDKGKRLIKLWAEDVARLLF